MKVLVIAHQARARAGVLEQVIASRGGQLDRWDIFSEGIPPGPIDEYAAVISLGGNMHAIDDSKYPWLELERTLMRRCLADRRPLLGLCLGAQLLAQAAGGVVRRARTPEIGWHEINLTRDARADHLFRPVASPMLTLQWHVDAFETATRHVTLARSAVCEQAFRVDDAAWGLQFHPELTEYTIVDFIDRQLSRETKQKARRDLLRVRDEVGAHFNHWMPVARDLLGRFLTFARARAA